MKNNNSLKLLITFNSIWTFLGVFIALLFGGTNMEWWQTLLTAIIPTLIGSTITGITTYKVNSKAQINANTEALNNLSNKLGALSDRSLENRLGVSEYDKSISSQIGVGSNDKSLSSQLGVGNDDHSICYTSKAILSILKTKEKEEIEKMAKFNKKQNDLKEKIDDITMLFKDWESLALENQNLKKQIKELKSEYEKVQRNTKPNHINHSPSL